MVDVETFTDLRDEIPEYTAFLTPSEHRERSRSLSRNHSAVERIQLGESGGGRPIDGLVVGDGDATALFIGAPHPNEPVGSMTCDFLARLLARNQQYRELLNYQFVFVPVADVDGATLNRGWFDGPFTLRNYVLNFYRPDPERDIEWRFPFQHRQLRFGDPPPATQALATAIRTYQPDYVASLHNGHVGSTFHCLSEPLDALYDPLRTIAEAHDLPFYRGEPDASYMYERAPGIFSVPTTIDQYEYIEEQTDIDPADIESGGGTLDFAREHNPDAVQLITEVPYWRTEAATDDSPVDRTRQDVLLEGLQRKREIAEMIAAQLDRVDGHLPEGRLYDTLSRFTERGPERFERRRDQIESNSTYEEPATRAQEWSQTAAEPYARLLYAGPLLRVIEHALQETTDSAVATELRETRRTVISEIDERLTDLRPALSPELTPIRDLVAVQARSALSCLSFLDRVGRFD